MEFFFVVVVEASAPAGECRRRHLQRESSARIEQAFIVVFFSLSLPRFSSPLLTNAYMCLVSSTASGAKDPRLPMDLRGRLLAAWCWRNWMGAAPAPPPAAAAAAPSLSFAAVVVAAFATRETEVPPLLLLSSPGAERLRDCCL